MLQKFMCSLEIFYSCAQARGHRYHNEPGMRPTVPNRGQQERHLYLRQGRHVHLQCKSPSERRSSVLKDHRTLPLWPVRPVSVHTF
jgi:hypothetical protein